MSIETFSTSDIDAMHCVENSRSSNFVTLVIAAGLNPRTDLVGAFLKGIDIRGCDLSDFDLSGCDLTDAVVGNKTVFPPPERMVDAKTDFIYRDENSTIVELMQAIETAGINERRQLLGMLIENYDSDVHIDRFLLNSLKKTNSIEGAVDLFQCLSQSYVLENHAEVTAQIYRILLKAEKQPFSRKKVGGKHSYAFVSKLIAWIADSDIPRISDLAMKFRSGEIDLPALIALIK